MADNVRFATYDKPSNPVESSGFNGFPFALSTGPLPTILSLDTQVYLFWRVRKWQITVDNPPDVGVGDEGPFILEATNPDDSTIIESELGLLGAWSWRGGYWTDGGDRYRSLGAEFAVDGTVRFLIWLYEDHGEQEGNPEWNASVSFGDDVDYLFGAAPYEFWPYANSAGLPVWDINTGAQLREPAS